MFFLFWTYSPVPGRTTCLPEHYGFGYCTFLPLAVCVRWLCGDAYPTRYYAARLHAVTCLPSVLFPPATCVDLPVRLRHHFLPQRTMRLLPTAYIQTAVCLTFRTLAVLPRLPILRLPPGPLRTAPLTQHARYRNAPRDLLTPILPAVRCRCYRNITTYRLLLAI